jgi:cyclase
MGIKARVIPTLLWHDTGCVRGKSFGDHSRRIGSIEDRIRLLERRDIDELIILDVSGQAPRFEQVRQLTEPLFCPITLGGGVKNVIDVRRLLANGADKVAINSAAIERPSFLSDCAQRFGSQAVVSSIDVRSGQVVAGSGRHPTGRIPAEWANTVESCGAGEILLTSVARDGTLQGYDLDLIREVTAAVSIPVIASGGCGTYQHMQEALDAGAHAVAAGAMFQFREATPKGASRFLHEQGYQVRL